HRDGHDGVDPVRAAGGRAPRGVAPPGRPPGGRPRGHRGPRVAHGRGRQRPGAGRVRAGRRGPVREPGTARPADRAPARVARVARGPGRQRRGAVRVRAERGGPVRGPGAAAPADRAPARVEPLPAVPGLGRLYVRGVAASGRLAATHRLPGATPRRDLPLPDVTYRVAGVPTGDDAAPGHVGSAEHLARYARLVGEAPSDVLPAGYLHVLGFPLATAVMVRPDFPLPL